MRKFTFIFTAMLVFAAVVYGQKETTNFAGTWNLDVEKSELGGRSRIKSMTMTVTHSENELSYERKVEREEPSDGGMGGGRGMGRGRRGGGNPAATFDLTGKETSAPSGGAGGDSKLKAEIDGSTLKLVQDRNFNSPRGEISIITTEKWSLSEDGNTLTVTSETETPRGTRSSTMVFSKAD